MNESDNVKKCRYLKDTIEEKQITSPDSSDLNALRKEYEALGCAKITGKLIELDKPTTPLHDFSRPTQDKDPQP